MINDNEQRTHIAPAWLEKYFLIFLAGLAFGTIVCATIHAFAAAPC